MKILQELLQLNEESVTLEKVSPLKDLIDPKTGKYYTGEVSVTGDVDLFDKKLKKLPVKFGKVGGFFACFNNQLTSLDGAPSSVGDYFDCRNNKLTSLEGAPSSVGAFFACNNNLLTTLEGASSSVGGNFSCSFNKLTSLEGAPSSVGDNFSCGNNQLTSLEGIHKLIKRIGGGSFLCRNNPIKSGGIGLILIEGLKRIDADQPAFEIINEYIGQGKKGVLLCQDELIEAGFEEYAKL